MVIITPVSFSHTVNIEKMEPVSLEKMMSASNWFNVHGLPFTLVGCGCPTGLVAQSEGSVRLSGGLFWYRCEVKFGGAVWGSVWWSRSLPWRSQRGSVELSGGLSKAHEEW